MRAEELRIGNYISCDDEVERINTGYAIEDADIFEPIPLTEEWLKRLGFEARTENAGNLPCFKKGNITVARWGPDKWQTWYKTTDVYNSPQYVHSLQNIYTSLTGSELLLDNQTEEQQ